MTSQAEPERNEDSYEDVLKQLPQHIPTSVSENKENTLRKKRRKRDAINGCQERILAKPPQLCPLLVFGPQQKACPVRGHATS